MTESDNNETNSCSLSDSEGHSKISLGKWIQMFKEIEQTHNISLVARTYDVKRQLLSRKYRNWVKHNEDPSVDKRGLCNRVFSEEEEKIIIDHLWKDALFNGSKLVFSGEYVTKTAKSFYNMMKSKRNMKPFQASPGWSFEFKKRHGIDVSNRRAKYYQWMIVC